MRRDTADYRRLFLEDVPLLDVRAPVEFAEGAFPQAVNRPLLTDAERHAVGIRYKSHGQDAAIALGYELVSPEEKARRVALWLDFARAHPEGVLYCFRGGLRSRLTQQMLREAGIDYPRVIGGYKALRRFALDSLARQSGEVALWVVAGRTGSGKTPFIRSLSRYLDLEGLAHHKGSAFGRRALPQPPQIGIDNALSIGLMKLLAAASAPVVVEDESRAVGSREITMPFWNAMSTAPVVVLEQPFAARVEQSLNDYVLDLFGEFRALNTGKDAAFSAFSSHLRESLARIERRLGGARYRHVAGLLDGALDAFGTKGDVDGFRELIALLLRDYYDPMYDHQIGKKADRIRFRGEPDAVRAYLEARLAGGVS